MTAQTRREFIRTFAAALAAALGAGALPGCAPAASTPGATRSVPTVVPPTHTPYTTPTPTCYAPVEPTPTATPVAPVLRHPAWAVLRQAWLDVRERRSPDAYAPLVESHQTTLHVLIDTGELDPAVATQLQTAFGEVAAYYAEHSATPTPEVVIDCYDMVEITPSPGGSPAPEHCYASTELRRGREALAQEAAALEAMAVQSALDPDTVDKARRALEQDIALFELVATFETLAADDHRQQEDQLVAQYLEGRIDVPPETAEAALILVSLLTRGEVP